MVTTGSVLKCPSNTRCVNNSQELCAPVTEFLANVNEMQGTEAKKLLQPEGITVAIEVPEKDFKTADEATNPTEKGSEHQESVEKLKVDWNKNENKTTEQSKGRSNAENDKDYEEIIENVSVKNIQSMFSEKDSSTLATFSVEEDLKKNMKSMKFSETTEPSETKKLYQTISSIETKGVLGKSDKTMKDKAPLLKKNKAYSEATEVPSEYQKTAEDIIKSDKNADNSDSKSEGTQQTVIETKKVVIGILKYSDKEIERDFDSNESIELGFKSKKSSKEDKETSQNSEPEDDSDSKTEESQEDVEEMKEVVNKDSEEDIEDNNSSESDESSDSSSGDREDSQKNENSIRTLSISLFDIVGLSDFRKPSNSFVKLLPNNSSLNNENSQNSREKAETTSLPDSNETTNELPGNIYSRTKKGKNEESVKDHLQKKMKVQMIKSILDDFKWKNCAEGTVLPHYKLCSRFYRCVKKAHYYHLAKIRCPPKKIFDVVTSKCTSKDKAVCFLDNSIQAGGVNFKEF